ncbi:MAG: hypothetical protein V3U54_08545 [Thermodesulfobacteriota bacterium]
MRIPEKVWIVFDPMDGPHVFKSRREAEKTMRKWEKEAKDKNWDSYWEMSDLIEYNYGDRHRHV